jgi:hypothetical protein
MNESNKVQRRKVKLLRSGDPKSRFQYASASDILKEVAPPERLLSTSAKLDKCESVGVLARVLYFTPGAFCPSATEGCLETCLGHSSGRMAFTTHAAARDVRTALYLERPIVFMKRLRAELTLLEAEALQRGLKPAARLNGTSDVLWERFDPDLFLDFPEIQFYDYTKINQRMLNYLDGVWPVNYHLTFSVDACGKNQARYFISRGCNVAVVFWPYIPSKWWGFPVIDGDRHDARFLDPQGAIVGLRAKGLARVDVYGFTARPCRDCGPEAEGMKLVRVNENTHRETVHQCTTCNATTEARWTLPKPLAPSSPRRLAG